MRSLLFKATLIVGGIAGWVVLPMQTRGQSQAGTPQYAQPNYNQSDWTSHYYGPPYYNWRGQPKWHGHEWMWQKGRSFYPGYRYHNYPQFGSHAYGGGYYLFIPGYYYPRQQ